MVSSEPRRTTVSAPGKVLLAGGYLVLDPAHRGIVVSTSSRFFTSVLSPSAGLPPNTILVRSPQFLDAVWKYRVLPDGSLVEIYEESSEDGQQGNKFVRIALDKTIRVARELVGDAQVVNDVLEGGLEIVIAGDNDFYSQRAQLEALKLPLSTTSLPSLPPFSKTNTTLANVHKTGLGSSAALITSLCSALLLHLHAVRPAAFDSTLSPADNSEMALVHNIAQYCHCLAQGKVGSGFDVSSAVWGSQVYRKFGPDALDDLMADDEPSRSLLPALIPSNPRWNNEVTPFNLPPHTRLLLADVDAGSDTPSLVGKVLKWRKESSDVANLSWATLSRLNEDFATRCATLQNLAHKDSKAYEDGLRWFAGPKDKAPAAEHLKPVVEALKSARARSAMVRAAMKGMGEMAGVPIEPDGQTKLLDACLASEGVLGCGVPGAGGYDALWVLVVDVPGLSLPSPAQKIDLLWQSWDAMSLCPLNARAEPSGGLKIETVEEIAGLESLILRKSEPVESKVSLVTSLLALGLSAVVGTIPFWPRS